MKKLPHLISPVIAKSSNEKTTILLTFLLSISLLCQPATAMEDTIVAIVNREIITLKDLREYLAAKHIRLKGEGKSNEEIIASLEEDTAAGLNRLIEEKILVAHADKMQLNIREQIVDERLAEVKKEYPSEAVFLEALSKDGLTITDLKNKIRDQLKAQSIIDFEVRSKIFVNPQEVTDYYEKNKNQFRRKEMVNLKSIFIKNNPNTQEVQAKIQKVQELLKEKSFEEVAQEYSSSPSLGIIFRGQLKSSIEEAVFKLSIGETSPPLATEDGTYIFKLIEKHPEEVIALDAVKEGIYPRIFQDKFRTRLSDWLEKLKKDAYIDIKQ